MLTIMLGDASDVMLGYYALADADDSASDAYEDDAENLQSFQNRRVMHTLQNGVSGCVLQAGTFIAASVAARFVSAGKATVSKSTMGARLDCRQRRH
jgi:hypothetical protein